MWNVFADTNVFDVVDEDTGKERSLPDKRHSRGPEMCILAEMKPNETRTFVLKELPPPLPPSCGLRARGGAEGVEDLFSASSTRIRKIMCIRIG